MAAYSLGADRDASDIDGLGTELDTGDTVTTNVYIVTLDSLWTKNKSGNITVSPNGGFINEAGVNCEWDANSILVVDNSLAEIRGTSGSPITYTGDLDYINIKDGGLAFANYLTYSSDSFAIYCGVIASGRIYCYNSTITAANTFLFYSGISYYETCSLTGSNANGILSGSFGGTLWLVDCTCTQNHANNYLLIANATGRFMEVHIIGTTNLEGSDITDSDINGSGNLMMYHYSRMKTTVDDGTNPLQNAMVPHRHKVAKGHIWYSRNSIYPPNFYGGTYKEMNTDASGINKCYALSKIWDGGNSAYIYISDENQAEAGDNAPYLVNPEYPNYQSPTPETEAWAIESGNGNKDETDIGTLTCSPVGLLSISSQLLSDYSITTSEESLAECDTSIAATHVAVLVNDKAIPLVHQGSNHWSGIIQGNYIEKCTNEVVTFIASDGTSSNAKTAGSNLTVTMSTVKVNPDPLDTIYQMYMADWDRDETDGTKPEMRALVDDNELKEYRGVKSLDFDDDGILFYEITEAEKPVGPGYNNINRVDAVSIDIHVNGTRAHFRKVIDMVKYIANKNRKHPTTYPANTDYPYDSIAFEGTGQEFSSKYSGHYRIIFTINLNSYWEPIDW